MASEQEEADTPAAGAGKRSSRTQRGSGKATSAATGGAAEPGAASTDPAGSTTPSGWDLATGWANAMASTGSESSELLPERAAGRPATTSGRADTDQEIGQSGAGAAPDPAGNPVKKAASGRSGGRPGPRVAITRTRQTKKKQ
jgi:hypothetical protein